MNGLRPGRVDVDRLGECGRRGAPVDEAFGVFEVGEIEDLLAGGLTLGARP